MFTNGGDEMSNFSINVRESNNVMIIDLSGEIETFAISQLKEDMEKIIKSKKNLILLNLSNVIRFNSTALGILIGRLRRVRVTGGDIKICNVTAPIKKVFDLMGVSRVFEIYSTEKEALEGMKTS